MKTGAQGGCGSEKVAISEPPSQGRGRAGGQESGGTHLHSDQTICSGFGHLQQTQILKQVREQGGQFGARRPRRLATSRASPVRRLRGSFPGAWPRGEKGQHLADAATCWVKEGRGAARLEFEVLFASSLRSPQHFLLQCQFHGAGSTWPLCTSSDTFNTSSPVFPRRPLMFSRSGLSWLRGQL